METTILSLASLDLNELEAFVELMFLAAYADGEIQEAERAAFRGQIVKGTHGQLDDTLLEAVLGHIERAMSVVDREKQLSSIRARLSDPRKRRAALGHAALVVLADGVLGLDEVKFLEGAAVALGETVETARQLLDDARRG
jgi:uncharacterized tellurite resistance protein B-like protein